MSTATKLAAENSKYFGNVKGSNISNTLDLLRVEMGAERYNALMREAPAVCQPLLKRRVLAVEWVPCAQWFAAFNHIYERHFGGDDGAMRAFVGRVCERDFNTFYRMLIRVGSPGFIIDRATATFSKFVDVGTLTVTERFDQGERHVIRVRLEGFPPFRLEAVSLSAYIERLLQMSGAADVRVEVPLIDLRESELRLGIEASYVR